MSSLENFGIIEEKKIYKKTGKQNAWLRCKKKSVKKIDVAGHHKNLQMAAKDLVINELCIHISEPFLSYDMVFSFWYTLYAQLLHCVAQSYMQDGGK